MKKIVSTLLVLTCLMVPFAAFAAGEISPTIDILWWTEPTLQFQVVKNMDEFAEYLELISTYYDLDGFNEMVLGTDKYEIVDMVIVTLDKPYEKVIWHTPSGFSPTDNLSVFMIATDLFQGYVLTANGDNNGNLLVNYSGIATPANYFMLIYMAD